jgi:hypothetical protein
VGIEARVVPRVELFDSTWPQSCQSIFRKKPVLAKAGMDGGFPSENAIPHEETGRFPIQFDREAL